MPTGKDIQNPNWFSQSEPAADFIPILPKSHPPIFPYSHSPFVSQLFIVCRIRILVAESVTVRCCA